MVYTAILIKIVTQIFPTIIILLDYFFQKYLNICGIYCKIIKDDLLIDPTKKFISKKNIIKTNNDHRIAMAFAIMGTKLGKKLKIQGSKYIKTSFPDFINEMNSLGGNLSE